MNCKNKNHSCNSCGERKCGSKHTCHSADMVEVVRCKDCIHSQNMPLGLCYLHTEPYDNAKGYKGEAVCVEPDDFCSYGERKQNEQR